MDTTSILAFSPEYFTAVRNPGWLNAEHTLLYCEVNFKHVTFEEWTPFTADPNDYMPYSKELFDRCAAGEFGPVAEYIPPPVMDPSLLAAPPANFDPMRVKEAQAPQIPSTTL